MNRLLARYDSTALRPPEAQPLPSPAELAALQALRSWCLAGALPRMRLPWAITTLDTRQQDAERQAAQLCLERDGSWQLAACQTAVGRIALRFKTKAHDLLANRERQPEDPWDSGYLKATPEGLQALAHFQPRRATLMVAQGLAFGTLQTAIEGLAARQLSFAHPVRLLVLR